MRGNAGGIYAAIYIGSYEVSLKVFEISEKKGISVLDLVRARVELGKDAFHGQPIGYELVDEICDHLSRFKQIMKGYGVGDCEAYSGPILQDAANSLFILDQIERRTGIRVNLVGNSEHRFLTYRCVASKPEFERMIQDSAAVVNVGGGDLQITLFVKGEALTTQHLVLGPMRLAQLFDVGTGAQQRSRLIKELIDKEMEVFKAQYYQDRSIKYLILTGDYILEAMRRMTENLDEATIEAERFADYLKQLEKKGSEQIAEALNLSDATDILLPPAMILYRRIVETLSARYIWVPGIDISDGIAYDYALRHRYVKPAHDFDKDVLSAAYFLSQRYMSYSPHIDALARMSALIYDAMKKVHGCGKHERLLLLTAAILHDCGKYVSFAKAPECAYDIILSSEIMGLSHRDRLIVANIVKYNTYPLDPYEDVEGEMDKDAYLVVAKCAAILRVANAMDRSHKQKFKAVRAALKDKQLIISIQTADGMLLEKTMFGAKAAMFEQVFSIKPVIKEKKVYS